MIPGEIIFRKEMIKCNKGKKFISIKVKNTGDRAIQVGSHFHFFEVNTALEFDRSLAYGKRLDIPSGAGVRFEPGDIKEINLVDFSGERRLFGFDDKVNGYLD